MKKVIFKDSHRGGVARERCNIVKRKIHLVPTSWKIMVCLAKELICPQAFLQLKDNPDVSWSTQIWQQDLGNSYWYMIYDNKIIIHMISEPSVNPECVRSFDKSCVFFCLCKPLAMQHYDNMIDCTFDLIKVRHICHFLTNLFCKLFLWDWMYIHLTTEWMLMCLCCKFENFWDQKKLSPTPRWLHLPAERSTEPQCSCSRHRTRHPHCQGGSAWTPAPPWHRPQVPSPRCWAPYPDSSPARAGPRWLPHPRWPCTCRALGPWGRTRLASNVDHDVSSEDIRTSGFLRC